MKRIALRCPLRQAQVAESPLYAAHAEVVRSKRRQ